MAKIMAIDYGIKRTGIAVTDDMQIIASGLTTVDTPKLFSFLTEYLKKEKVEAILVGDPKQMNGMPSESAEMINTFVEKLRNEVNEIEIVRVDERFTSKLAFQSLIQGGAKKKQRQDKGLIDEISATILLQDYLSQKK
ncbi:Holliday junction resolvase RuvX [Flavobacterium sp. RNTU_13]|uniref:Holliday junction resolvase RuvX n=1 Tax=Flavobacterium sp. RNTU_13 TaxID=3375145 RepID=UPI003987703B